MHDLRSSIYHPTSYTALWQKSTNDHQGLLYKIIVISVGGLFSMYGLTAIWIIILSTMSEAVKKSKIGSVVFTELHQEPKEMYSDGAVEDRLLELFKGKEPDAAKFLEENPGWASTYHLTPARENLLNWHDFKPGASLLEVGAGCGALTGLFAEKCDSVVALELSKRRAEVNAHRHKARKNLEVVVGNLEHLDSYKTAQYDYVVCVGVLEYAGRFIGGNKPFTTFLEALRKHTKPNGTLILAIENKLGLKYLSGAREDHVRRYMEGFEDYPHYEGIRTFGKQELTKLFQEAGFAKTYFYFPYPDYKLPHTVYSQDFVPGVHTPNIPSGLYPTPTPDQPRQQLLREQLAIRSLAKNGLYDMFANSFLVFASSTADFVPSTLFARGSTNRKPEYRISTRIQKEDDHLVVEKLALSASSHAHITSLRDKESQLDKHFTQNSVQLANVVTQQDDRASFSFIDGPTLEHNLVEALAVRDFKTLMRGFLTFEKLIDSLPSSQQAPIKQSGYATIFGDSYNRKITCVKPGIIDLNFDNLILSPQTQVYTLIDYEWVFPFFVPKNFLMGRALLYFFSKHQQIVRAIISPKYPGIELGENLIVPQFIYNKLRLYFDELPDIVNTEASFQQYVGSSKSSFVPYKMPALIKTELLDNLPDAYDNLEQHLHQQAATIKDLRTQLQVIANSKSWQLLARVNSLRSRLSK